ncbi:MAG TPA: carbonic anhydrase [Solirubrobacterales bacterium]|nr:carbonic anhydrase [Solirubrobacterales bacterium]
MPTWHRSGRSPKEESPGLAIVTCMDARLDRCGLFDLWARPAHVIRNAGGRVTADVLRSLAVSCAMQTDRVVIMHHTGCAMAEHSEEDLHCLLPDGADLEVDFLTIDNPSESLLRDVRAVKASTLIPQTVKVSGMIYDLCSRTAREIEDDRVALHPLTDV